MARQRYKGSRKRPPRSMGRSRRNNNSSLKWIILFLVIITAGVFVTKKLPKKSVRDAKAKNDSDQKKLDNLLGGSGNPEGSGNDSGGSNEGSSGAGENPGGGNTENILPPENDGTTSNAATILMDSAAKDYEAGNVISCRNKLNKVLLEMPLSGKDRESVKKWLTKLSGEWLFSKKVLEGDQLTEQYQVKSGDYFSTIASKYKVPHEIIMMVNGITDARKLPLKKIKVVKGPFRAKIQLSKFNMDLYLQDQYVKSYDIGIGKPGKETPTGKWRLKSSGKSDKRPTWRNPDTGKLLVGSDPEYPLGDRWIPIICLEGEGLEDSEDGNGKKGDGIALHGTNEPESIGTKCSRGCIRLNNDDVIEVYNVLEAGISEVVIED